MNVSEQAPCSKKGATELMWVTTSNLNRFSKYVVFEKVDILNCYLKRRRIIISRQLFKCLLTVVVVVNSLTW